MNGTVVSATLVPLTSAVGIFTGLVPDLREVRQGTKANKSLVNDLRVGETTSCLIVLFIGVAASYLSKSVIPFIAAAIICVGLVAMYESILTVTP